MQGRVGTVDVIHRVHGKISSVLLFLLLLLATANVATSVIVPATWVITAIVVPSTAAYVYTGVRQLRSGGGA